MTVSIDHEAIHLKLDDETLNEFTLSATVLPEDAENRSVRWDVENADIAHVDSFGIIRGLKVGETELTAITFDGEFVDSVMVYVYEDPFLYYQFDIVAGIGGYIDSGVSGSYASGDGITLSAGADDGYVFAFWSTSNGGEFINEHSALTVFEMHDRPVAVTANFVLITYEVTLSGTGTGSSGAGNYAEGVTVSINAGTRNGYTFNGWTANGTALANPENAATTFVMPANNVTVTANWLEANDTDTGGGDGGGGGGLPDGAFLEDEGPPLEPPPVEFISFAHELYKLGLFQGYGDDEYGNPRFGLENVLNRIEALVLTIRLLGLEEEALAFEGPNPFADVPEWADRYAAFAFANGITTGVSATAFNPERAVTAQEFTAFLLRSLGYSDGAGGDFLYAETLEMAIEVSLYTEDLLEELSEGDFLRGDAVIAMVHALLTKVKGDEETVLIDTLVESDVITREDADAFIAVIEEQLEQ